MRCLTLFNQSDGNFSPDVSAVYWTF